VDRLNATNSCLVDFGHGNKFQVLGDWWTDQTRFEDMFGEVTIVAPIKVTIVKSAVWPLRLLSDNLTLPLENEAFVGVTNPFVALGKITLQRCDEAALDKGLCITSAEECVLSLCTRHTEQSVVNGTTHTAFSNEDFGCLSKARLENPPKFIFDVDTYCWQAEKPCDNLHFSNFTSFGETHPLKWNLDFCPDDIVVQSSAFDVQGDLLTRLTGNQTARWSTFRDTYPRISESVTTASSSAMDYITATGLEPVLAGVAASLTQQVLLANTSEKVPGTVYTTETYVAVDWPWLIYPVTLVLGSIALLTLTALHSHRCGLKIWKSSVLPLLYRTLDPDLLARQPVLHDVSTMTGVAGKVKVTLVETSREDGVVLTQ
jgi:hypothetical protein